MNFSIIGPSGYIGKRHLDAINKLDGKIVSYLDLKPCNEVNEGIFFENPDDFFSSFQNSNPDYCIICSPNYLHAEHILKSLDFNTEVICEKPICINKEELNVIQEKAMKARKNVYSIMQLRLHPVIDILKQIAINKSQNKTALISVITPRNKEYLNSWKTDKKLSGGILFNLGIHYFDLLIQAFGRPLESKVIQNSDLRANGVTNFNELSVEWFFSIDPKDQIKNEPQRIFNVDGQEIIFSKVSNDLHFENYNRIMSKTDDFKLDNVLTTMECLLEINEK